MNRISRAALHGNGPETENSLWYTKDAEENSLWIYVLCKGKNCLYTRPAELVAVVIPNILLVERRGANTGYRAFNQGIIDYDVLTLESIYTPVLVLFVIIELSVMIPACSTSVTALSLSISISQ
jgi:hypothetical protein